MSDGARSGRIGRPDWDLLGAAALVLAFDLVVLLAGVGGTALRLLLGLPILLLVPGYVVVAALYPSSAGGGDPGVPHGDVEDGSSLPGTPLTTVERIALSVAVTVVVVATVALVASAGPWSITPWTLAAGVTAVTLAGAVAAAFRRTGVSAPARPPAPGRWLPPASAFRPRATPQYVLSVLLVLGIVGATGAVGYAADGGIADEQFTEFAVLAENEDGELVADDYPTTFTSGEARSLYLRIDNHEGRSETYTVVALLEDVGEGNATSGAGTAELDRFDVTVDDGSSRTVEYEVRPTTTGDRLRLSFLLYSDEPPSSPDRSTADHELHLWITVSGSE